MIAIKALLIMSLYVIAGLLVVTLVGHRIQAAAAPTTFMTCQRVVLAGVGIDAHRCASSEVTCMFTEQGAVSCWK